MDSNDRGSNEDYLYGDLLQQDSFVSPAKTDNENSLDIYDGLDTDYQGGGQSASSDTAAKSKPAKDCFDLYEEILTEERTAKEISLKEFQEKFVERERKVEELLKQLHEIQIQNSTLLNENTQLKKNISALIKTARLEIVRKDEEINRLNRRQSMNWIGNPGLRLYHNQHHHPPGSFNVPTMPQTDNRCPSQILPCPPRPANVEHCQLAANLNEGGNCLQDGPLGGAIKLLEPKKQCNLQKSLSNSHPVLCRDPSSKSSSPHTDKGPIHRQNAAMDKTRLFPCEERRRIEKLNAEHLGKHGNAEKLDSPIAELSNPRNKSKEPSFPENMDKVEQTPRSTRPHSEMRGPGRLTPEKNDKVRHRFTQDTLIACSKDNPEIRDKRSYAEKEERHKEKDTRRSDLRERELKVDRKKDQRSNREVGKEKQRDDKLRGQETEKERESERRRFEKMREHSKLTNPGSPRKSSKRNTCVTVEHTTGERRERKIESKKSGKERSIEDIKDRRSKHSNWKMHDDMTPKDGAKQSSKGYDRNIKKNESRKEEKGKSEHKDRRDRNISRRSSRDQGDCAKREKKHQGEKEKSKLSENNEKITERNCVHQTQKRVEESVHGNSTANFQTPTDEQNSIRDTDPKLQFMETLQLTVSPVKRPSTVLCEVDDEMKSSQLLSEDEVVRFAEQTASASEEADFNLGRISNEPDETLAMDTNCKSAESPVGGSEIHVPQGIQEPADLEMVPSTLLQGTEEEEGFQIILVEDAAPQQMECDCTVDYSGKLAPIVVETMGTVEVISETIYEMAESPMPLVEIDSIDTEEHVEPVGSCSEVNNESVGEVNGKSPEPTEANCITIDGQDGSSDCPIELGSTIKNEIVSLNTDGKPEDSGQSVDVSAAVVEEWTGNSEPDFTSCELQQPNGNAVDSSTTVNKTPVKNVCIPDDQEENSIQSIDFTYIGCIPEPISPLTSPLRPVRPSTLESSGTQAERDVGHKDSAAEVQGGCSPRNCTLELNKENQEPLFKDGEKALGISVELSFSEEIEEGEIVSDEEECVPEGQKPVNNIRVEKEDNNKEKGNPSKSNKKETRLVNPDVSTLNCSPEALIKIKSSKKRRKSERMSSDQNADGLRLSSSTSSVERNQIKSSVSNLMGALMVTRKSIRKKYMKLHKQFEIHRFQRIVEIASADFTSIVKGSNFPKSRQPLKTSICAVIENILSQAKCNGIVKSIFLQQAPNMKEKLWLFVEKQFDFMFDKVREMFISCESISLELALEEKRKNERIIKKQKKNTVIKQLENKVDGKLPKLKRSLFPSEPSLTNNLSGKKNSGKNKQASDDRKKKGTKVLDKYSKGVAFSAIDISKEDASTKDKNVLSVTQVNSNASSDPPINSVKDCHDKTELGILTEQQASTLTFNLVSDAQMGEIFKCLLQGSDLLEQGISTLECNSWPIPEKVRPDIGTQLSGSDSTSEKAPPVSQVDAVSWPPVTPNTHTVGLRQPLDLDILDESCMLEIPDKVVHTKDSVIGPPEDSSGQKIIESSSVLQMRSSISSILMEDLAVSLTVPSPLKSDGQISFLTSQNGEPLRDGVSEAILSAHYSESALLDEEDASEQDIHLALDSDNSSSRSSNSSTWNKQISASAFQYQLHPPMQAVVMEKSNDHFIVKIRCRPPDTESTQQSSPSAAKENRASELGPSSDHGMETVDETPATCSSVNIVLDQDHVMSESLPNQPLIVEHPVDNSRNMEKLGIDVDMKLSYPEENRPSIKNHVDVEPSPNNNAESVVTLTAPTRTATVWECGATLGNRKRKNNVKVDSTVKRARKENELLKSNNRKDKETKVKRSSSSSAKKALSSKTVVTPKKAMGNSSHSIAKSPSSLPAKNVIKKNGEVVVTWTREDDRTILLGCQQKGANEETFGYIAGKLHRSPRQVSERFHRLMKLFKKSENMNN
ncbi:CASP8-associated protein 2 [Carcharodon carcharias]|uniref:CASP8-associated protein 2 n=1 Tax=Carcharodon carcharias TaxID=13397 RepID=UPI001B7F701F|nr:CASP8-associated protein 2 [Carcharodon carcharias]XP_041044198.1 CASP8-associated protein 2 [Carcharodon carcharias]